MSAVECVQHGPVTVVRLARPDALNALDDAAMSALLEAVETAGRHPDVRAVVLTGSGRAFCAGGDLRWFADHGVPDSGEPIRQLTKTFHAIVGELRRMPKATVAAVNGVAAGGGLSLACACDFRVAGRSVRFRAAYGNAALSPDGGLTWTLPRLVGRATATQLLLRDVVVGADEALRIGLVHELCDDAEVLEHGIRLAKELAARDGEAVAATRRLLDTTWTASLETQLEDERQAVIATGRSAAHRAALREFLGTTER